MEDDHLANMTMIWVLMYTILAAALLSAAFTYNSHNLLCAGIMIFFIGVFAPILTDMSDDYY